MAKKRVAVAAEVKIFVKSKNCRGLARQSMKVYIN